MNRNRVNKYFYLHTILFALVLLFGMFAPAYRLVSRAADEQPVYHNPVTGFRADILDEEKLLDDEERALLLDTMMPVTEYGNVLLLTTEINNQDALTYAGRRREEMYGRGASAVVFMIATGQREVVINSDGRIYQSVRERQALSITDNIYRYASEGEYATCATEAFVQILAVLRGERIREPMRHISNILLAVSLSTILAFIVIRREFQTPTVTEKEWLNAMAVQFKSSNPRAEFIEQVKRYEPVGNQAGDGDASGDFDGGGGGSGSDSPSGGGGSHLY